jgi:hypothetical protein
VKKLLLLFVILYLCFTANAQVQIGQTFTITSTGRTASINETLALVPWHHITFSAQGTITGFTFTVDSSKDGSSWTTGGIIPAVTVNGGVGSVNNNNGVRANFISINVTTLTGGGTILVRYDGFPDAIDPCAASYTHKSTTLINNLSALTKLIAGSAGQTIYVCKLVLSNSAATTPTVSFSSGTGTTCGTGTINVMGVMTMLTSQMLSVGGTSEIFDSGLGRDICITPGGTTASISGFASYVLQ